MKNANLWRPTKYVRHNGRLRASRDRAEVGVGSRLMADLIAGIYDDRLAHYARGRLLDVGCGQAPLFEVYGPLATEVTCVDWASSPHTTVHIDVEHDLTKPLPFGRCSFDTVIASDVLEHIPTPAAFCTELARILAPGGSLLINTPFYYCLHERPHDYYRYTEFALRRFVQDSGLTLVEVTPIGGSLECLTDLISKHLQFLPLAGRPLAALAQSLTLRFHRTGVGQRLARRTAEAFPFGYFLMATKS